MFKPPGLPCLPPHADPAGPSVARWLVETGLARPEGFPDRFQAGIAHRLDVPTSGVLAVAATPEALERLRGAFSGGLLEKRYLLVAARQVPWDRHEVDRPLAHHPRRRNRMVVQRGRSTRHRGRWYPARTRFERLGPHLWRATIRTGVTHQVRLHAAFVGLALAGDRLYGGGPTPPGAPAGVPFLLHHEGLAGKWPDGAPLASPVAPPPGWWEDVLAGPGGA